METQVPVPSCRILLPKSRARGRLFPQRFRSIYPNEEDFSYADLMFISPRVNKLIIPQDSYETWLHSFLTVKLLFIPTELLNSLHYQLCKIKILLVGFLHIRVSWVTECASGQMCDIKVHGLLFSRSLSSFPFQLISTLLPELT